MKVQKILSFFSATLLTVSAFSVSAQAELDAGGPRDCVMPVRDGNPETTSDDEYFDAYIRYNDFTPKISAGAVKTFNSLTAGKKLTSLKQTKYGLFYQKNAYVATYSQMGQTVYAVWAESEFDLDITIPDAQITVYDMQGNIIEENVQSGVKRISATPSPVYIVFDSDPVNDEQNFIQKVFAFFKRIFRVIANGFVVW